MCKKEMGVIVDVRENEVFYLNLEGQMKRLSRFDIIYMANYRVSEISFKKLINNEELKQVPPMEIKSIFNDKVISLLKGWPVSFSHEKISFLNFNGNEQIIDRSSIWKIYKFELNNDIQIHSKNKTFNFVNPYPFQHCAVKKQDGDVIYPDALFAQSIKIKKELDSLVEEFEVLKNYENDQVYYAVPTLYETHTELGLWGSLGLRYGSSGGRSSSFTPSIISDFSEGPFGFQSKMVTGSSPMPFSVHEEPQTQFYYALKADYIRASFMYDVNRFLIGEEKYKWQPEDLENEDFRLGEISHISVGFDYSNYTIEYSNVAIQYAFQVEDQFEQERIDMDRFGLFYQNKNLLLQLYYQKANQSKVDEIVINDDDAEGEKAEKEAQKNNFLLQPDFLTELQIIRFNLESKVSEYTFRYSLIYRDIGYFREKDRRLSESKQTEMYFNQTSITNTIYTTIPLRLDFQMSFYFSLEQIKKQYGLTGLTDSSAQTYPKAGVNFSLVY